MNKYMIFFVCLLFLVGCEKKEVKKTPVPSHQNTQELLAQGMQYLQDQDIPRAIQSFDLAIKEDPSNVDNYLILGQVYMKLELYDRAVDTFAAAVKVAPNSGEGHFLLASAKALDGRIQGAVEAAQRSVELFVVSKDEENFKRSVALLQSLTEPVQNDTASSAQ